MQTIRLRIKDSFKARLSRQVEFIALDSPARARKFKKDIIKEIKNVHI